MLIVEWLLGFAGGTVLVGVPVELMIRRHTRLIHARVQWWREHNPPHLQGTGPDYWRNPYRGKDWKGIRL